jgi:hypothetical protein
MRTVEIVVATIVSYIYGDVSEAHIMQDAADFSKLATRSADTVISTCHSPVAASAAFTLIVLAKTGHCRRQRARC